MRERAFKELQKTAYHYIKDRILDGTMIYNQIYSESKIASEIGISRTPVRDAVHRLFQEDLIDIIPNKGFVLHKLTKQDIIETYDVRSAIEGYCSHKAALDHMSAGTQELIEKLQASLKLQHQIFETSRDVNLFAEEDQNFHYLLVSYSDNQTFIEIFSQYMHKIKKCACYSLTKDNRMQDTLREHEDILNKIRQGDGQGAYEATHFHMQSPMDFNLESIYE